MHQTEDDVRDWAGRAGQLIDDVGPTPAAGAAIMFDSDIAVAFRNDRDPLFDLPSFRSVVQTDACTVTLEAHAPDRSITWSAIATLVVVNANSMASHPMLPA